MSGVVSYAEPVPAGTPSAAGLSAPRPKGTAANGQGRSRLVSGRLSIDKSGRAFIRGVADDATDDAYDFDDTIARMG